MTFFLRDWRSAAQDRDCVPPLTFVAALLVVGLAFSVQPTAAVGQDAPATTTPPSAAAMPIDPTEQYFPDAATLKADPEPQQLLARAEQCVQDGRWDLAAVLWQKVLDDPGSPLVVAEFVEPTGSSASPLVVYEPLARRVERRLASLPPAGLAAYRTTADAEAKALLAAAPRESQPAALAAIVRRFFLCSQGDEAAFKLACLALDQHEFADASRLLSKILTIHPDPSVSKEDLLVRLAVAAAHLHNHPVARQSLAAASVNSARLPPELLSTISSHVERTLRSETPIGQVAAASWSMDLGRPDRTGQMPSLPAAADSGVLGEQWSVEFSLGAPSNGRGERNEAAAGGALTGAAANQPRAAARDELAARWVAAAWRPTGRLLFDRDSVVFKAADRLVCYRAAAPASGPQWQSAYASGFEPDAFAQQVMMLAVSTRNSTSVLGDAQPKTPAEIQYFGDRTQAGLSLADNIVYCLEGLGSAASDVAAPVFRLVSPEAASQRGRSNRLTAYHANSGKAIWTCPASGESRQAAAQGSFLAAPTPSGDSLLLPLSEGGTLWLVALDRATGRLTWRTYLCEEPRGGASSWAAPMLAVQGQEAYIAAGCGVVFAVEAASGAIRWAVRYRRDAAPLAAALDAASGRDVAFKPASGWDDDVVIPYGHLLLVLPSDSDRILALDRENGRRLWESPRISPAGAANYCLGVAGRGLFVAGTNVVRRYETLTGQIEQETTIENSFGRGCLTPAALYIPSGNSIEKFAHTLQRQSTATVVLPTDEPVGNLFSDGERLWSVGAARVCALTSLDSQLERLAERIAAGDADALLQRMRVYMKLDRHELALADLRSTYALYQRQLPPSAAAERLLAALLDLKLPRTEPLITLQVLTQLLVAADAPVRLPAAGQTPLAKALIASITALGQRRPPGAVEAILAAAPLFDEDYLLNAAAFAVEKIATAGDVQPLTAALESGPPAAQLLAVRAAARLAPQAARTALTKLLTAGDDRVRLAAARALVNLGEQAGILETLVELLDSSRVPVRIRSQHTLEALTGEHFPFAPEGSAADRAATAQAWRRWIAARGSAARLVLPLTERAAVIGRVLVASPSHLVELDGEHKERWRMPLAGAAWGCQGLPNGHRLVAINSHSLVVEYDHSGQEVWRKDRLPAPPTTVERLESGHTLVACGHAQELVEIAPDGVTRSIPVPGHPISAQRLDSGSTLVVLEDTQRVVEVDRTGQVVWEAATAGRAPVHAVRLTTGNTLVTLLQARQVVEFDPTGQNIVWRSAVPLIGPAAAQRLAGGETIVADQIGVRAIDASGRQVLWQHRQPQVTGLSSF